MRRQYKIVFIMDGEWYEARWYGLTLLTALDALDTVLIKRGKGFEIVSAKVLPERYES